jgi:hypothetical protein
MLFDKTDLYEIDVDMDQLRLVELESCNDIYADNDNHYIYFDDPASEPIWKSEPTQDTQSRLKSSCEGWLRNTVI